MPPTLSTSWPTTSGAPPLWATPRDPARPSDGPQIAVIAETLGTPLLPWQRYVADVATERRADGSYEYQVVIVSVPRQTGKTTLLRALGVHRALVRRRDVFYTAQTGKDARARWMDLVKVLRVNPALKEPRTKVRLRGGSEHVEFPGGHVFQCFAPTPESLHGYTPPLVLIDEAFALNALEGELLMGAIGPAQFTVVDKQIWIVSTAGTAESTFLHDWIERGMTGTPRVACFVWGADDTTNPYTADGVASYHPGVGFQLGSKIITVDDVLSEVDKNTKAEYERAYGNRRTLTSAHLIPTDIWRPLADGYHPPPPPADLVLTYDVGLDRRTAAITATWTTGEHVHGRLVQAGPGTAWLADAVAQLVDEWRPARVAAVDNGPVLEVTAELLERGYDIETVREREYATACGAFLSRIDHATIHHDGDEILERSVTGLVTRAAVTDGVAFSRRHSVGDSSPGIALAVGAWIADRGDTHARPVFRFAS